MSEAESMAALNRARMIVGAAPPYQDHVRRASQALLDRDADLRALAAFVEHLHAVDVTAGMGWTPPDDIAAILARVKL